MSKHCRDYNHADALYAMLEYGEHQALKDLRSYLDLGRDPATRRYDGTTELDLETLTVLKLVEDIPDMYPSDEKVTPFAPHLHRTVPCSLRRRAKAPRLSR